MAGSLSQDFDAHLLFTFAHVPDAPFWANRSARIKRWFVVAFAETWLAVFLFRLKVRLRVLIPAVENSISGTSFRPRDIFRARNGITVEIGNTDAEGRLILADALALADEDKPELIVDFATLTGAARSPGTSSYG